MHKHTKRTRIPVPGGSGIVPTGAVQFQNDWPGLFLRGDAAIPVMTAIRRLQDHLKSDARAEVWSALSVLGQIANMIDRDVVVRASDSRLEE